MIGRLHSHLGLELSKLSFLVVLLLDLFGIYQQDDILGVS